MLKPFGCRLILAGLLATQDASTDEGRLSGLSGGRCFGAYAGVIGDRPITLLLARDQLDDTPDLWYSFDDTGRYDAATNRFRYARRVLEDDGSEGDAVRFVARDEQTGEAGERFTGQFDPEGGLRGECGKNRRTWYAPFGSNH